MSSPNPQQPNQTQMTTQPAQKRMVKIRALAPIRVDRGEFKGQPVEHVVQPGEVVEVSEAEAKEFCDKKIDVGYKGKMKGTGFGSHHPSDMQKTFVTRAERVKA